MKRAKHNAPAVQGLQAAACAIGANRTTLWRAVHGRCVPKDRTLLRRFYSYLAEQAADSPCSFRLLPGMCVQFKDDAFMRMLAESHPSAFRLADGTITILAPIICSITNLAPLPAIESASAPTQPAQ